MKKNIIVCDICDNEIDEEDEKVTKCSICDKDLCENCINSLFDDDNVFSLTFGFAICENCSEDIDKDLKRFFKQKEIKEKLIPVVDDLKTYIKKVMMLRNLKDEGEEQDDD